MELLGTGANSLNVLRRPAVKPIGARADTDSGRYSKTLTPTLTSTPTPTLVPAMLDRRTRALHWDETDHTGDF